MGHNTIDTFKEKADSHHPTGKIVNDQNIGLWDLFFQTQLRI